MRYSRLVFAIIIVVCMNFAVADIFGERLQQKITNNQNEKISILVYFQGTPSFEKIAQEYRFLGDESVIRHQAIRVMKDNAEHKHYWLMNLCNERFSGETSNFQSIWLINAVALKATPAALKEISQQPGIMKIELDELEAQFSENRIPYTIEESNIAKVWKSYQGKGIKIAVIDTGVNIDSKLQGHVVDGGNYIALEQTPRDDHSHGTSCAVAILNIARDSQIVATKVIAANGHGLWSYIFLALERVMESDIDVVHLDFQAVASEMTQSRLKVAYSNVEDSGVLSLFGKNPVSCMNMAHVTGLLALLKESNPKLTNTEITQILEDALENSSTGIIDIDKIISIAESLESFDHALEWQK